MKKFILSSTVMMLAVSIQGCHADEGTDELMDPLSAPESCTEGFKHSSELQTLEVKNAGTKAIRIVDMTGLDNGAPRLGTDAGKFITISSGQTHKFNFIVDSYANGGSIVYQADEAGKRTITLDPICVETFQVPVYVRQSEGDDAWIAVGLGDAPAQVLHIGLDDAWASEKTSSKSHAISIDETTFTKKDGQDEMDEAFRIKP
jgi:hypothetical protein